jgi:hypothetical protein
MDWYSDETQAPSETEVTVKDLEALGAQIKAQREVVDEKKQDLKAASQVLDGLEGTLLGILEQLGKTSYDAAVGRFGISHRSSVRVPQGEDRERFFGYLRGAGEFESLITVNSQTLNGWYKQKFEAAKEAGEMMDFSIPGLDAPTITPILSFREKK